MNENIINEIRTKKYYKKQILLLAAIYIGLTVSSWKLIFGYGIYAHDSLLPGIIMLLIAAILSFEDVVAKMLQSKKYSYKPLASEKLILIIWFIIFNYGYFAPLLIPSVIAYLLFRKSYNYQRTQANQYLTSFAEKARFQLGISGKTYIFFLWIVIFIYIKNVILGYSDWIGTSMLLIGVLGECYIRYKGINTLYISALNSSSLISPFNEPNTVVANKLSQVQEINIGPKFELEQSKNSQLKNKLIVTICMTVIVLLVALVSNIVLLFEISFIFIIYSLILLVIYLKRINNK